MNTRVEQRWAFDIARRSWIAFACAGAILLLLGGCLSPRYQHASKKTPPPTVLDRKFPPSAIEATLNTVIVSGGPGSWKKEAFWDEYMVTLHNAGDRPLQVQSVQLTDFTGARKDPGTNPWKLEKESKTLGRRYRDAGMAVVRTAAPRVLVTAAEPTVAAGAGVGAAGAAAAATATAVALPAYGATVLGINIHNRKAIDKEFDRRRLGLPLSLAPGETRTGSVFFPMVPDPCSLTVGWGAASDGKTTGPDESSLSLDFLRGLHVKDAAANEGPKNDSRAACH